MPGLEIELVILSPVDVWNRGSMDVLEEVFVHRFTLGVATITVLVQRMTQWFLLLVVQRITGSIKWTISRGPKPTPMGG